MGEQQHSGREQGEGEHESDSASEAQPTLPPRPPSPQHHYSTPSSIVVGKEAEREQMLPTTTDARAVDQPSARKQGSALSRVSLGEWVLHA